MLIAGLGVGADHNGLVGRMPGPVGLQPQVLRDEGHSVPRNSQIWPCMRPEPKVQPVKCQEMGSWVQMQGEGCSHLVWCAGDRRGCAAA